MCSGFLCCRPLGCMAFLRPCVNTYAWFPAFGCRSAVAVSPFRCAIVPLPFFRSVAAVAVARENGIAGNVFPLTAFEVTRTLIGCPPTAEWQK